MTTLDFRCSLASRDDAETMAGTAPTETSYLLVEHPGPWGRKALEESRMPEEVRAHLLGLEGVRVLLVRRHRPAGNPASEASGVRVFAASLGETPTVTATVLDDLRDLPNLDPATLEPYDGPLWLVCTNGRRDRCCAEVGRPVAAALAGRWPEATWETTHLGGHRFAGTLLALPGGQTLGRLDPEAAVHTCAEVAAGRVPVAHARGRAGLPGPAQFAELHVREALGLAGVDEVVVEAVDGATVRLRTGATRHVLTVDSAPGTARQQSCGDQTSKPAAVYAVRSWVQDPG